MMKRKQLLEDNLSQQQGLCHVHCNFIA